MTDEQLQSTSGRPAPRPWGRGFRAFRAGVAAIGLAALAVSAVLAALAFLLSGGNEELSERIVALVNRSVGTDSTRLEVERVTGTLFQGAILERPRLIVVTPQGEMTWASARRVTVDYDLLAILFSKRRSLAATIDSPVVRLVHDQNGRLIVPRFASRPARRSGATTRVAITARNGLFSLDWKGIRFIQVRGKALLTSAPGQSILFLEELSGLPDPATHARGRVRASGSMTIAGSALRVDPLEVVYGSSRTRARLDWDLEKGRVTEGLLALTPLRIEDVSRLVGSPQTNGVLRGEMTFSGLPTDGNATACLTGEINKEPVDTLALTASFAPRTVAFSGLRLRVRSAEVTGGGTLHVGGPIEAAVTFHGVNPAAVPWWKAPEGMPRGSLAGRARLVYRGTRPRPSIGAIVALDESRFGRLFVHQGQLRIATRADGSASLDSGWVDVPGGRLVGRALMNRQTLDARLLVVVEDLGRMDSLIAPMAAEHGRGRVTADLSGPIRAPSFTAHALLWGGRLSNGMSYDSVRVESRGRLGAGGEARAEMTARGLRANERRLGDAVASVTFGKTIVIERYRQALGDSTLSFRGTVTPGKGETQAILDSVVLAAGTIRFRNVEPVRLTIGGGHIRSSSFALDTEPGRLDAAFDWNVRQNRIDARGALRGFEVTRIPGVAASADSLRGEMNGQFLVSGALSDPDVELAVDVLRPAWSGVTGDSLALVLNYRPGALQIEHARWAALDSRVNVEGTVRASGSLETWLRAVGRKDESWAKGASLALVARAESLDLARIAPADTSLRTLGGRATFTARVSGTGAEPVVMIAGTAPHVTYQGLNAEIAGADLAYANRALRVNRWDVKQGESISSITGEIPIDLSIFGKERMLRDRPLHLTVRVTDADFKLASVLSPYIAASGGKISVMAGVSGTPRTPIIQGTVRLSDGMVRFAGRDEVVQKIQLEGTFDQNQLTITRMAGSQGKKGTLSGSGAWQWGGLPSSEMGPVEAGPPGRYQFSVKATEFTVTDRETYLFQLTGNFSITSGRTTRGRRIPHITGSARLSKGNLTLDLAARDREEAVLPFYYDINVDVPSNLFYRTVDSEVELQGTLRLMNEGEGNLALGTMTVRKGRYYLFTREIGNLSGEFLFNSLDRTDPELAVDGETTITGSTQDRLVVNVSLTGRASQPVVHLWDKEGRYSQADLWKFLTFGQVGVAGLATRPTSGVEPQNGSAGGGFSLPVQAYLFRNAERWLSQSGWIDTFDLRSGSRSGTATGSSRSLLDLGVVGAGKYVTRDLYVNYSRDFSGQNEQQVSAEYRFSRHLLLRGQRAERHVTDPRISGEEYNLDLKVRLEY